MSPQSVFITGYSILNCYEQVYKLTTQNKPNDMRDPTWHHLQQQWCNPFSSGSSNSIHVEINRKVFNLVLHHNTNNNNDMHLLLASDKWKEKRRNKNDTETQRKEKKKGDQILGRMRRTVPPAPSAADFSKRQAKIIRLYYWLVVHVITSHHLPECRRRNITWWSQMNRQDILIQNV